MTLQDDLLENTAKALAGESFVTPEVLAVATTEVTSIPTSATELTGEIGTRINATTARTDNELSFTSIRSGTDVVDTVNGDFLKSCGLHATLSGADLQLSSVIDERHTTSFDLEFVFNLEVIR